MGLFSIFKNKTRCYNIKNIQKRIDCYKELKYKFNKLKLIELRPLHKNIFRYIEFLDNIIGHDYNKKFSKDITFDFNKSIILFKDFLTSEDGDIHLNSDKYIKEFIDKYLLIKTIYDTVVIDMSSPINQFNSNILKRYIINMDEVMASISKPLH